jgi:GR25 family glycosyltransferase involved in LPS biosynthesis
MITCDSAASMAEAINNLLEDDMVLSQQTAQFQSAITRHYSREQFNSIVNITLSNLTSQGEQSKTIVF